MAEDEIGNDGYVEATTAYYRRPGVDLPSRVQQYITERVDAIQTLAQALGSVAEKEKKAAAGSAAVAAAGETLRGGLNAVSIGPERQEAWTCSPEVVDAMRRLRSELRKLPASADYKSWVGYAVDGYFASLEAAGAQG